MCKVLLIPVLVIIVFDKVDETVVVEDKFSHNKIVVVTRGVNVNFHHQMLYLFLVEMGRRILCVVGAVKTGDTPVVAALVLLNVLLLSWYRSELVLVRVIVPSLHIEFFLIPFLPPVFFVTKT